MDWISGILVTIILLLVVALAGFIVSLPFLIHYDNERIARWESKCTMKGGILLDNVYKSGKNTHHNYICVDPKIIIPYQD